VEPLLLLAAGGLFALLFVLNALIHTIRRTERIGFWDTLLAFLITLVLLAALLANAQSETPLPLVQTGVLGIALVLLGLSVLIAIGELRRPQRLRQSRGVFGVGAALLVIISTFTVPLLKSNFDLAAQAGVATATPTRGAQQSSPQASTASDTAATQTDTPVPTATSVPPTLAPSATPTLAPTSTPTPAPTATRIPATATPSPTLVDCQLLTNYNINLRAAPDAAADVLLTIPFNTSVSAFGRNQESTWWLVSYEGQTGWVSDDYVTGETACLSLPVQ
jgi:4-amino-4-deoxy-L-arabinose transferase-like glycosyltransferase